MWFYLTPGTNVDHEVLSLVSVRSPSSPSDLMYISLSGHNTVPYERYSSLSVSIDLLQSGGGGVGLMSNVEITTGEWHYIYVSAEHLYDMNTRKFCLFVDSQMTGCSSPPWIDEQFSYTRYDDCLLIIGGYGSASCSGMFYDITIYKDVMGISERWSSMWTDDYIPSALLTRLYFDSEYNGLIRYKLYRIESLRPRDYRDFTRQLGASVYDVVPSSPSYGTVVPGINKYYVSLTGTQYLSLGYPWWWFDAESKSIEFLFKLTNPNVSSWYSAFLTGTVCTQAMMSGIGMNINYERTSFDSAKFKIEISSLVNPTMPSSDTAHVPVPVITDTNWHHLTVIQTIIDDKYVKIAVYYDGKSLGVVVLGTMWTRYINPYRTISSFNNDMSCELRAHYRPMYDAVDMQIDEMKLWSRALSPGEVFTAYRFGLDTRSDGDYSSNDNYLIGWYKLDVQNSKWLANSASVNLNKYLYSRYGGHADDVVMDVGYTNGVYYNIDLYFYSIMSCVNRPPVTASMWYADGMETKTMIGNGMSIF